MRPCDSLARFCGAVDVRRARVAPDRELLLRLTSASCADGSRPMRNSVTNSGATSAPSRRPRQVTGWARHVQRTGVAASSREAPAAARRATSRAPASDGAGRHRDRLLGVAGVRDARTPTSRGPTNFGVRICFSTMTGTGSRRCALAASTSPAMPEPPMPQHDDVVDPVRAREAPTARIAPADLVRVRRAVRADPRPRRGSPSSRLSLHGRVRPRRSGRCRRPRPWPSADRARRRRRSRPRR